MVRSGVIVGLCLLLTSSLCRAGAGVSGAQELFEHGCDLYESGQFDEAAQAFESLIKMGLKNSTLYYNLGNSYFKQGNLGKAVVNYRRALLLSPRDRDVKANLELVRSMVGLRDTTASFDLSGLATFPLRTLSPEEIELGFYIFAYAFAFCFVGCLFSGGQAKRVLTRVLIVCAIVTAVFLTLEAASSNRLTSHNEGVIVADCSLMSGPGKAFEQIGHLRQGVEVKLGARSGVWLEVRLPTGQIGWVEEEAVELI